MRDLSSGDFVVGVWFAMLEYNSNAFAELLFAAFVIQILCFQCELFGCCVKDMVVWYLFHSIVSLFEMEL